MVRASTRLRDYQAKRNFAVTPEPKPARQRAAGNSFVVQRHWARREHFDLRLEMDGTMKSWAVTRGPSNDPKDKRLAVRVEDHPLDYASFEGTIPKGQYGGGTVMIWDRGTWRSLDGDAAAGLREGKLKMEFNGIHMRGAYALVRMKTDGEKRENWLLIKDQDRYASSPSNLLEAGQRSAATDRSRTEIEDNLDRPERVANGAGVFIAPMLCDTREEAPEGSQWLHEIKYDGYRLQLAKRGSDIAVRTREGLDWTGKFPEISTEARKLKARSCILDGEAAVFDPRGISDFALLQQALKNGSGGIVLMAFDLLQLNGTDLRKRPLIERKKALEKLIENEQGTIRFAGYVVGKGREVFDRAVKDGAEGVISKKISSTYQSRRSASWLKIKQHTRDDVAIVGYVPSLNGRRFGALVTALGQGTSLRYAGRVGTGFSGREMDDLYRQLAALQRLSPPPQLAAAELAPRNTVWVEPRLRAEVAMSGLTPNQQMRHPRFLAIRNQAPSEVRVSSPPTKKRKESGEIPITHSDRVVFPAAGVTKGAIADYYGQVTKLILPHLRDRPVSFLRAPENIDAETFFQRHPLNGMTRGVERIPDPEGKHDDYLVIRDADGLRTSAQFGVIELHGWGCRAPNFDNPDRAVFDLDPDESVPFDRVKAAAFELRRLLDGLRLRSFPMLTGGKGIHVILPLDRSQSWEEIETFTKGMARGLARSDPQSFVAVASKLRRRGKIYIDWLRNKKTATAIVPWSLRARAKASIAAPLTWNALKTTKSADAFAISTPPLKDPWPDFFAIKQSIAAETLQVLRTYV